MLAKFYTLDTDFEAVRDRLRLLAVLGIPAHISYYFIWLFWFPQKYESWLIRSLYVILVVVWLIWDRYEVDNFAPFRMFTYFVLTIGLPFFFLYMYLMNDAASVWLGSLICGILYLALVVDVFRLVLMTIVGSGLALAITPFSGFPTNATDVILSHLPIIFFALVGGVGFKYLQEMTIQKNRDNAIALAGSIAHELRTPILGIRLELENLADICSEDGTIEERDEALRLLRQHHDKSSYIIDSLLQNVQRGRIDKIGFRQVNMGSLVQEVVQRYPFFPNQRELVTWDDANNFHFHGDSFLMNQVIMNLIANALQSIAAAEKGKLHIKMSENKRNFIINFEDTGLGLHAKDRARIFERFYSKTSGGAGLGLALCQRVVTSFSGKIKVDSKLGVYTRISILLPKKNRNRSIKLFGQTLRLT